MQEDFVQYLWKFQLFEHQNLLTTEGEKIEILHQGNWNYYGGADFLNAKIKIGEQLWVGNVEIHLTAEDWLKHKHQQDESYNNVILHVVFFPTQKNIKTQSGRILETLVLQDYVYKNTLKKYEQLRQYKAQFVACEQLIDLDNLAIETYYERLVTERLERKINQIEKDVAISEGDLDKAFLISLFRYFGAPQNKVAFETLAYNLELKHIIKQAHSIESLEALLFGMAGFLDEYSENKYHHQLENEYAYIRELYKIDSPMKASQWVFGKVRPPNFPTLRIAQLATLLHKEQRWFSYLQAEIDIGTLKKMMQQETSIFWQTHYLFNKEAKKQSKKLSDAFINKIILNVIAPFLFYYGKFVSEYRFVEQAFDLLAEGKKENNRIVNQWKNLGLPNQNALHSQALLQLHQTYCKPKRCLDCRIGFKILNENK